MIALLLACTKDEPADEIPWTPHDAGPHAAGFAHAQLRVEGRDVPVTVWFPSENAGDVGLGALSHDPDRIDDLLADAPDCTTRSLEAVPATSSGTHPAVVYSHCHTCLGVSGATTARHLATHGWVVAMPDHTGNTLFDELDGDGGDVDGEVLDLREADVLAVVDALQDGTLGVDVDVIAAVGHSFGSVTTGRALGARDDLAAGVFVAAPPDTPLFDTPDVGTLDRPTMFVVATEDNSITELGNVLLRDNAEAASTPSYAVELVDAGHWSVSDLAGIVDAFLPGCGDDVRQTDGSPFTYPDADDVRQTSAAEILAFLQATVLDDPDAQNWIEQGDVEDVLRTFRP